MNEAHYKAVKELADAAISYTKAIMEECDDDAHLNALVRLEVAAEKFVESKTKSPPANASGDKAPSVFIS